MFKSFSRAETLADGFLFSLASAKAGIPVLLVAPQSGGKSTIIEACKRWLKNHKHKTLEVSRIGLKALQEIAGEIVKSKEVVLLNDDYSNIGESDYMMTKMAEIIASLSYSKGYYDYGLKISIKVKKLGFISGVQPLWIKTMMDSKAFATNIREKFIRYYLLPHKQSKDVLMEEAIEDLLNNTKTYKQHGEVKIPSVFLDSLAFQVGRTRAREFSLRLVDQLIDLFPIWKIPKLLRFFARRIGFEKIIVEREFGDYSYKNEVFWKGYTVLYWCLRYGLMERDDFYEHLGVSSYRSVSRAIDEAFTKGWILMTPTKNSKYIPNYQIFKEGVTG